MAYGYKVVSITEHTCTITLTAYPEKKLTICREGDHFVCHVKIDNRQAILQSLYVKASPNNPLNVEYVELQGITTDTGVPVTEKGQQIKKKYGCYQRHRSLNFFATILQLKNVKTA